MAQPISILFLLQIIVTVTLPVVFIDSFIISSTKKDKLMLPSSNSIIHKTSSSSSSSSSVLRLGLSEEHDNTDTDEIGKGIIDYQSNTNQFGRGEQHLSAVLYEGDTVIYRTGNWYVDGVLVGDEDAEIVYKICRIETIQIVWTHNCEHGVLRGLDITTTSTSSSIIENENENDLEEISSSSSSSSTIESTTTTSASASAATSSASASSDDTNRGLRFLIPTPFVDVEFGPEQLVGRINTIEWIKTKTTTSDYGSGRNEEEEEGFSSIPLQENMWIGKDEML